MWERDIRGVRLTPLVSRIGRTWSQKGRLFTLFIIMEDGIPTTISINSIIHTTEKNFFLSKSPMFS